MHWPPSSRRRTRERGDQYECLAVSRVLRTTYPVSFLTRPEPEGIGFSPPGGGAELPVTSDDEDNGTDEITLKRDELDALIEDAVRKDRQRR